MSGDLPKIMLTTDYLSSTGPNTTLLTPVLKRDTANFGADSGQDAFNTPKAKIQFFNPDRKKLGLSSPLKPFQVENVDDYLNENPLANHHVSKAKSVSSIANKPMDDKAVRFRYLCKLTYKGVWNE